MQSINLERIYLPLIVTLMMLLPSYGQSTISQKKSSFFAPSDTFNQKRFNYALGFSTATYTGFSVGLYHTWYKQFEQEQFHTFNDWGEWNNMDKVGHLYTAYFQGVLCYKGAKWTGLSDNKSIMVGVICGGLFQTTLEVMDAFSSEWGFSMVDMGANISGIGLFALQQKYWGEQRIMIKVSSFPRNYDDFSIVGSNGTTVSLHERADNLFGSSFAEKYLKDYNAQAYWASINVNSFLPKNNKWPDWLNIALGYGADNMFGGFKNEWETDGERFVLAEDAYPRVHQYYLGLDFDFTKIKTKNHFLKGLFSIFNIFKAPSPALEINSKGEVSFHIFR
ncbi:MAG: hypothetical protein ACI9P5_001272 [Saprospiraceae bacterium]|jgi:hypothetical protein